MNTPLKPCPFCGTAPTPIDETNFPGDYEHPWDHRGCFLDGVRIDRTSWSRRAEPGRNAVLEEAAQVAEADDRRPAPGIAHAIRGLKTEYP